MHILCTICSDLVNQAESLFVTKCGHIFHHQCLAQWIERSKSCPQCRNKVTEKCMFRMYPTVSNESSGEDAATLQSRLDDAMLQLRTQRAGAKELEDRLAATAADLNKKEELLKASEKRLGSREAAAAALREQLELARAQARDAARLRDDHERLHRNLQTLNGLQRVLNATAAEVEGMLRDYSDVRTVAVFAAALKRALCDSEGKKREWRARQLAAAHDAAAQRARADDEAHKLGLLQEKFVSLERKYESLKHKRKASEDEGARAAKLPRPASPAPAPPASPASPATPASPAGAAPDSFREQSRRSDVAADDSFGTLVGRIEAADSPYLPLRRSGLALCALQQRAPSAIKPSELGLLAPARSIFRAAPRPALDLAALDALDAPDVSGAPAAYDGLGGHARPDAWPAPRPARAPLPRPGARHRLKKFDPAGSRDISQMFGRARDP